MKRPHDPLRLDMASFAADAATLQGAWPGADLPRLAESQTPPQDTPLSEVVWSAQGERLPVTGGDDEIWLALQAQAGVWLSCQRCLQPFTERLSLSRRLRFVRGEAQAEALDAEIDDDVLALTRSLDLRELVEDELLLALPLVPRHEQCPQPLPLASGARGDGEAAEADAAGSQAERRNPFEALKALKLPRSGGGAAND